MRYIVFVDGDTHTVSGPIPLELMKEGSWAWSSYGNQWFNYHDYAWNYVQDNCAPNEFRTQVLLLT